MFNSLWVQISFGVSALVMSITYLAGPRVFPVSSLRGEFPHEMHHQLHRMDLNRQFIPAGQTFSGTREPHECRPISASCGTNPCRFRHRAGSTHARFSQQWGETRTLTEHLGIPDSRFRISDRGSRGGVQGPEVGTAVL